MNCEQYPLTPAGKLSVTLYRPCLLLVFLLALWPGLHSPAEAEERFPVIISGGAHAMTVPWHPGPLGWRLNPTLSVGTDRTLKRSDRLRLYQTARVGFFQHYWWMTGLYLDTELGSGYEFSGGFRADLRLGAGYLHYFWRRETLELKDGEYVKARDWGRPSLWVPLTLELGYAGRADSPLTVSPFICAQWAAQVLFTGEIPAMTHFFILAGVRIERGGTVPSSGR